MNIDNIIIRNATVDDIEQIVTIKVNGWKNAYDGIVDSSYLNTMSLDEQISKYKNYSLKDIFVAELDNQIIGFCRVYNYDSPQYDSEIDCEIREIYVRPDLKRMGI